MALIKADILDIKIERNEAIIYAISDKNERIIFKDNYYPYYFAEFKEPNKELIQKIMNAKALSKDEIHQVKSADIVQKKVGQEIKELIKIEGFSHSGLDALHYEIKKINGYIESYERDVEPDKKYLFDRQIAPLRTLNIELGEDGFAKKVEKIKDLRIDYPIMCFDIETYNPDGKSDPKIDPIIMISYASGNKKGVLTWKKCSEKYCETLKSEKAMIERFKEIILRENPAFLATYNGDNFDIPYISR